MRRDPDFRREPDERFEPDDRFDPADRFELEPFDPDERFELFFLAGTLAPFFRASESPMAIACFRLFTFLPLPLFSVPFLRLRIELSTDLEAFFP